MFTGWDNRSRTWAFTLLEVTLAVAILGMMALAIYRFVNTNLTSVRLSTQLSAQDARYDGLANLLTDQLRNLPTGQGVLAGDPYKFNNRSRDEMTWVCSAGPGLFTRYATGQYSVTLKLRPIPHSDEMELGVERNAEDDNNNEVPENRIWVSLLSGLTTLEIRYYDPRLNSWVDRWTDRGSLPHLIRLTIGRPGTNIPWEAVLPLRPTPL